ncbi:MAG: glycosyltransferase [Anaerolineae bacterium]|nr:glycosyltransferase [Anaerolineae bacterium]
MMLYKLLQQIDRQRFDCRVISISGDGPVGEKIRRLEIPVLTLGMQASAPNPVLFFRLFRWLKDEKTDIIQTWMYHADFLGGLAGWLNRIPVVWGIRNATLHVQSKRRTEYVVRICAGLSAFIPVRIISCSQKAEEIHITLGYNKNKFKTIPNGFDLTHYAPNETARKELRKHLKLDEKTILVGHVARFDPQKDHTTLIEAARLIHQEKPDVRFVLCGDGINWQNDILTHQIDINGLHDVFYLLGRRDDIPFVMAALDMLVSSSQGEAFPNVLGEAMACGVPCVTTDAGDSGLIVGECGYIVPVSDPQALADGMKKMLNLPGEERQRLGVAARQRVMQKFNLPEIVKQYEQVYNEIISRS